MKINKYISGIITVIVIIFSIVSMSEAYIDINIKMVHSVEYKNSVERLLEDLRNFYRLVGKNLTLVDSDTTISLMSYKSEKELKTNIEKIAGRNVAETIFSNWPHATIAETKIRLLPEKIYWLLPVGSGAVLKEGVTIDKQEINILMKRETQCAIFELCLPVPNYVPEEVIREIECEFVALDYDQEKRYFNFKVFPPLIEISKYVDEHTELRN